MKPGHAQNIPHAVLLLPPPPPCCPAAASVALDPPLPEGEMSRDAEVALLALPRLLVVVDDVTLGHVLSPKPERAILKEFLSPIFTNSPEHFRINPDARIFQSR